MNTSAGETGQQLREGAGAFLARRRLAAALTLAGMASLALISLYQLGIVKRLPEPPIPGLDAKRVNGSAEAYKILHTPDAVLGLGSYAATLGLIALGGGNRTRSLPLIPVLLGAKASLDVTQAAALTVKSWSKFRSFSLYSLITAGCSLFVFFTVLPEAKAAWNEMKGSR